MKNERRASRQVDSVTNGWICQEKGQRTRSEQQRAELHPFKYRKVQPKMKSQSFNFRTHVSKVSKVSVINAAIANLPLFSLCACVCVIVILSERSRPEISPSSRLVRSCPEPMNRDTSGHDSRENFKQRSAQRPPLPKS